VRITFVLPFINLTGGVRVLLDYANWLHNAGHETTIVYPSWPYRFQYTRRQQWIEFQKHRSQKAAIPWFDLRCPLLRVPLIRTVFLPRADLVVATAWPTVHDVLRLHPSRGKKLHLVFHHESGTGPEDRIRATYSLPFYRIAFSNVIRETAERQFGCRVHAVVPNGVDTALFFPDGQVEEKSVLFLFHPDPRKGAAAGIDALSRLHERVGDIRVRVCGTVRPERLPDWMPFEFHPDDATLRQRYSSATALLYPSRYEGFGLPPLEAMACGCPPVTTPVGAIPEFAVNRRNALIAAVGDIDGLVDALQELIYDSALRRRLSLEGLRTADRFSLARVAPLFGAALEHAHQTPLLPALTTATSRSVGTASALKNMPQVR
jgi:glycosyltransferase involved in cell wall biosynthesis